MIIRRSVAVLALFACAAPAFGADANAGKMFFRAQCALCHSAEPHDNGGAQGPSLSGVIGRHAASGSGFSYTKALAKSNLTWDAATLDRFPGEKIFPESLTSTKAGAVILGSVGARNCRTWLRSSRPS